MRVVLTRTSPDGSRRLKWTATVTGLVPQLYRSKQANPSDNGYVAGAKQLLGMTLYVDGTEREGYLAGPTRCRAGAPLVQLAQSDGRLGVDNQVTLSPGTHHVVLVANACTVSAQDEFTVTVK
jgi:hypothetical protein